MNQKEYIHHPEKNLHDLLKSEVQDTISEVEMHFIETLKLDRSEQNIIKALGSLTVMAKSILLEYDINQENHLSH